ncbi:MAG: cbb3-type cytochrome c oxidase subunit I [Spirosomataceae bacterium]
MKKKQKTQKWLILLVSLMSMEQVSAQSVENWTMFRGNQVGLALIGGIITVFLLIFLVKTILNLKKWENQLEVIERTQSQKNEKGSKIKTGTLTIAIMVLTQISVMAQYDIVPPTRDTLMSEPGVIITLVLLFIPLFVAFLLLVAKLNKITQRKIDESEKDEAERLATWMEKEMNMERVEKEAQVPILLNVKEDQDVHFFASKRKPLPRPKIDPKLTKLIVAFLASAVFWLVLGTTVGEYVGIKFIAPDADSIPWLSFGRLRPVHTNLVFWGWASLGMLGLGYYVVPTVGNGKLASLKMGWYSLHSINLSHTLGTVSLMAGVNNGGGEYREYIWPIMVFFAIGLGLSMTNYLKTIAQRKTKEIYISNWYITSASIFLPIIALVSYLPWWQDGIGETILQGFYMHQAVGLWFMFFSLGLLYYFIPQQLNKPIFSYSLGVLAFWTQILFYTLIGTHHFVFSSLPWWLQTVAIVGSVGMLIPVTSGTINFLMTCKGSWSKVSQSYSLPFFLVGVIYYFTGSFQGTAEAFRSTNIIWHFTDFTVAHSHITMYGIITFILFAGIYAIVPRLTGNEPSQILVGAHFWFALLGLQFYTIPLMIGGTLRGLSWVEGKAFVDSVVLMAPYWLWRAIGGSMMWISHLILAYNLYKMVFTKQRIEIKERALQILEERLQLKSLNQPLS